MAKKITPRNQDYSQWYNDIVQGADLAESSQELEDVWLSNLMAMLYGKKCNLN